VFLQVKEQALEAMHKGKKRADPNSEKSVRGQDFASVG